MAKAPQQQAKLLSRPEITHPRTGESLSRVAMQRIDQSARHKVGMLKAGSTHAPRHCPMSVNIASDVGSARAAGCR